MKICTLCLRSTRRTSRLDLSEPEKVVGGSVRKPNEAREGEDGGDEESDGKGEMVREKRLDKSSV